MSEQQTENPLRDAIAEAIRDNQVILFMKGTPEMPACGFSMRTVQALQATGAPFAAVDILPDPRIRQELSALSNWPTIPQLFVNGELVGGCDIVTEMYESGELHEALGVEATTGGPTSSATGGAPAAGPGPGETADPGSAPMGIENRLS
jgi:monothiol glutaredoxin